MGCRMSKILAMNSNSLQRYNKKLICANFVSIFTHRVAKKVVPLHRDIMRMAFKPSYTVI